MRQLPTPAEAKLWQAVRQKQLQGRKWRRQAMIGPYIADFYCPELRLIIEVDGATHAEPGDDTIRSAWLQLQGLTILRFWNNEVMGNLPGVLEKIAAYPSPNPLPQGEGAFSKPER